MAARLSLSQKPKKTTAAGSTQPSISNFFSHPKPKPKEPLRENVNQNAQSVVPLPVKQKPVASQTPFALSSSLAQAEPSDGNGNGRLDRRQLDGPVQCAPYKREHMAPPFAKTNSASQNGSACTSEEGGIDSFVMGKSPSETNISMQHKASLSPSLPSSASSRPSSSPSKGWYDGLLISSFGLVLFPH